MESVKVGDTMYKAVREEKVDGFCTKTDVGSLAPSKVLDTCCLLWGASGLVRAVVGGFTLITLQERATGRTMAGEGHRLSIRVTLFGDDPDNLRDDLSALLYKDLVIDMEVKGFDEIGIVE